MRMTRSVLVCLLIAGCATAFPLSSELDGDSAQVESIVHEVRVRSPLADLEVAATNHGSKYDHGGDSNDDVGYLRTHSSKGNDGYQHFDSFHKKDGDKYGVETHSAYGKAEDSGNYGGSHHDQGSYSHDDSGSEGDDGYGAGTIVKEHYRQASDDEDKSEDFDDVRARARSGKGKSRLGAGTTVNEHFTKAGDDNDDDNEQDGTGEYSDEGGHFSGGSGGDFYEGGGGGHFSGGEGSYHGGGGGSSYHGGGGSGGGGSYHGGGGASHSEGGDGGGDKSYYTEYSKGDKDNGSHGNSYGDSSSYGDEYHH